MLADVVNAIHGWILQHPHWAYLFVFLVAAGESLFVVGLILPGVALMFAFGALVAMGALELGPTLIAAAVGAVAGDTTSFWIGRHFRQRLRRVWPFSRYEPLLDRGVDFLHRHGTMSVLLARFVGPLRPILPAVAGMLDMPPRRFMAANVASALLWAPAYTFPGLVFGASLALAAEVAGRLAVLIAVAVFVLWFGLWLVRGAVRYLQPRSGRWIMSLLARGREYPLLQPLIAALLDPAQPEARGLATLVAVLALAGLLLTWLLSGWLAGLDAYLHAGLLQLRNPTADPLMVLFTELGNVVLLSIVLAAGCIALLATRRAGAALHWIAAFLSVGLLTTILQSAFSATPPPDAFAGAGELGLPSAHTALSLAVYGFIAVLVARELAPNRRWIAYAGSALLVIPIAFSRLYLGAHFLSDVLVGAGVGLACVGLFGIAFSRHPARATNWPVLITITWATLLLAAGWRVEYRIDSALARYAQTREPDVLQPGQWWSSAWQSLPALREDFRERRRQPLGIQYAGDLATLRDVLAAEEWREPVELSTRTALLWLSPDPDIEQVPVMSQIHRGLHDVLHLVRRSPDGSSLHIVRFWPTRWQLADGDAIFVGSVAQLELRRQIRWFSYVGTTNADPLAIERLRVDLANRCTASLRQRLDPPGAALLVRDCQGAQAGR